MANSYTERLAVLDTTGWIWQGPIVVRKVVLIPNAHSHGCLFKTWTGAVKTAAEQKAVVSVATNVLTSTGNFVTANVAALDILKITYSSSVNTGTYLVVSRDSDDAVTLSGSTMTNETTKVYSWDIMATTPAIELLSQATYAAQCEIDFGPQGRAFKNLALTTLSSSSDKVYLYLM